MAPDELEARVNALLISQTAAEVKIDALTGQVGALAPLNIQVTELKGTVKELHKDVHDVGERVADISKGIIDRAKEQHEDRRSTKLAMYGLIGVVVSASIAILLAVLTGTGHA